MRYKFKPVGCFNGVLRYLTASEITGRKLIEHYTAQLKKRRELEAQGICPECEGTGEIGTQFTVGMRECPECKGTGNAYRTA